MDKNKLDGVNLNDESKLVYRKQKIKGGVTKKVLAQSLSEYFDDDELSDVIKHVLSQRSEKIQINFERK